MWASCPIKTLANLELQLADLLVVWTHQICKLGEFGGIVATCKFAHRSLANLSLCGHSIKMYQYSTLNLLTSHSF